VQFHLAPAGRPADRSGDDQDVSGPMMRSMMLLGGLLPALLCAACSAPLTTSPPTLMSGADVAQGRRGNTDTFHLNDRIIQVVDFTWPDPTENAGVHLCEWKWFRDGQLVSDTPERRIYFRRTPFTLHTARPAAPLGVGHYTVETLVDGQVVATSAFSIIS
jgi:hypothetical protein